MTLPANKNHRDLHDEYYKTLLNLACVLNTPPFNRKIYFYYKKDSSEGYPCTATIGDSTFKYITLPDGSIIHTEFFGKPAHFYQDLPDVAHYIKNNRSTWNFLQSNDTGHFLDRDTVNQAIFNQRIDSLVYHKDRLFNRPFQRIVYFERLDEEFLETFGFPLTEAKPE